MSHRWENVFPLSNPSILTEISDNIDADSILFAYDMTLKQFQDDAIRNLFLHRVMVFSSTPDFSQAQYYLHLGAMGYGNAMMHESHLHSAFQALSEGNIWLHPDFILMMVGQIREQKTSQKNSLEILSVLSQREREVALLLGEGQTHQEISNILNITIRTVKAHATAIYQKLSVKDRLALSLLLHS
ncbi:LuxR C-terminal-related transcriptional regulator [Sulfuricurvum sp. PD_MW2]|jgi:DNA-binding NarL/FixJ family response regulator|uniref:response regulator transcription factor n=1 Tax=Sulfuricurvum sp. PD_MW2 TaxID=2027917 RepID=UPI0025DA8700|nr:LuxR C-terminal-related transcriptional regulator [Sulfuricurvum sp. PD_MW2]